MQVKDVMTSQPGTCGVDESANEAARIMWERDCGAVPVIDSSGCVAGIVTDRDICMAAYFQGRPLSAIPLREIMAHQVCTCEEGADVIDVERTMRVHRVRRLPVVDDEGALAGIVSLSDLAQNVVETGALRQTRGDSREFIETVAAVTKPRHEVLTPIGG